MSDAKPKPSSSLDTPVAKRIPRPPNSFLIYRKEHAKKYAGLVATELSTKLAMAWKKETPERHAYYAELAERAKREHAIKFPGYKFTPVKRGTGKRALQLAAIANAARAAGASGASPIQTKTPTPRKKANSSSPSSSSRSSLPEISDPILASTRSGRQISKPQRYTPSVAPYSPKRSIYSRSAIPRAYSSSLFFGPSPYENYSLEAPMVTSSSLSPSPTFSQANNLYNLESGSDLSDPEEGDDNDYQGSDYTDRVLLHLGQQPGMSPTRSWIYDNTSPMANSIVFEPLVMETFEPECLSVHHHDPSSSSLWTTPESSPTAVMMHQLYEQYQQHVFPNHHYYHHHSQGPVHQLHHPMYAEHSPMCAYDNSTSPSLEEALPVLGQQGQGSGTTTTDPALQFSIEMDKLQRDLTSLLPSPVSTPLHHPSTMATSTVPSCSLEASSCSLEASSCSVSEGGFSFMITPVIQPLVQEDIMMSPALSTCSSSESSPLGGGAQDAQSYFARALELL
ncbi:hypothetical protein BGZ52_003699 [Haplosporangium bisporale]|nr:hypothetical protein BGZ52_003699 [Haplosporangium bisporale]